MFFLNALDKLKESTIFKKWAKDNKDSFLNVGCIIFENDFTLPWMIGYYDGKRDIIASFTIDESGVKLDNEDKIYREPDSKVLELDLPKVKIDIQQVMDQVDKLKSERYKKELIIKYMFIIQTLAEFGTIWNATLFTKALNAINFKIDASSGKLISETSGSLIQFGK